MPEPQALRGRPTEAGPEVDPRAQRVLVALCVTVTIAYGVLYYAFTVLAPAIVEDTGWSATAVTAAFSAGSLLGALAGILTGRVMQRRGPRAVMTAGSLVGTAAIVVVATAPSYPLFVAGWLLAGAASTGMFYPPAFAALTQWFGTRRVRAITTLTLVAGFASTIFAPLTAFLGEEFGWRTTYLILAGLVFAVTAPLHGLALRLPWHAGADQPHGRPDRQILTSRPFLVLSGAAAVSSLAMYASLVHLVPLLLEHDISVQLAAWALGLSGAGQVAGRLLYPMLDRRLDPNPRAALVIAIMAATLLLLALIPGPLVLLMAIAVISGAARGLFTLIKATVVSDHWGTERYAALNGVYTAPAGIAAALAPAFGAGVAAWTGSYDRLFLVLGLLALVGAVLTVTAGASAESRDFELLE